jgi:RNA polymerase sigma-70 factor (ECF subfamily)
MVLVMIGQTALGMSEETRHSSWERDRISAAQAGDVQAFNALVGAHQLMAFRTAVRILGDGEAAADATQDAFLSAYRHVGSFRGESFAPWLARIVMNACYDRLRAHNRHPVSSLDARPGEPDLSPAEVGQAAREWPEERLARNELNRAIEQGLQSLPFDQQATLVLADIDQFSYKEIAEITNTNIGTVKSRLARARTLLRDHLLAEGYAPSTKSATVGRAPINEPA